MTKPAILAVDDDPVVSQAITRDLRARYGADYRIIRRRPVSKPSPWWPN